MFKKIVTNRMFWIGVQSAWLFDLILEFIAGDNSWQKTMIYGAIFIMCIGLEIMTLNKEETK